MNFEHEGHQETEVKKFKVGGRHRPAKHALEKGVFKTTGGSFTLPETLDYTPDANTANGLGNMLGNDTLGDCVEAGVGHVQDVLLGNIANTDWYTNAQAVALYSLTSGYVPGEPNTDNGSDEQTVLNDWVSEGIYGNGAGKAYGWVGVESSNTQQIQEAIYLNENVFFGIELPDAWVNPFPSANGFVWDVDGEPNPDNGHAFPGFGYSNTYEGTGWANGTPVTANGVIISTWGMTGLITWAAINKYIANSAGGELYTILSPSGIFANGTAPNGIAYSQLTSYLVNLANTTPTPANTTPVPVPNTAPTPVPNTNPVPVPNTNPTPVPVPNTAPTPVVNGVTYTFTKDFGNMRVAYTPGTKFVISNLLFNPVNVANSVKANFENIENGEQGSIRQGRNSVVFTDLLGTSLTITNTSYNALMSNAMSVFSFI